MIKLLRTTLTLTVVAMLAQAAFAGKMLGGDGRAAALHELGAKILVVLGATQTALATVAFSRKQIARWLPLGSLGLLVAEIAEFAAGHLHYVALHVPLALAIFGGAVRQLYVLTSVPLEYQGSAR